MDNLELAVQVGRLAGSVEALERKIDDHARTDADMHKRLDNQLALIDKHIRSLDINATVRRIAWKWAAAVGGLIVAAVEVANVLGLI